MFSSWNKVRFLLFSNLLVAPAVDDLCKQIRKQFSKVFLHSPPPVFYRWIPPNDGVKLAFHPSRLGCNNRFCQIMVLWSSEGQRQGRGIRRQGSCVLPRGIWWGHCEIQEAGRDGPLAWSSRALLTFLWGKDIATLPFGKLQWIVYRSVFQNRSALCLKMAN